MLWLRFERTRQRFFHAFALTQHLQPPALLVNNQAPQPRAINAVNLEFKCEVGESLLNSSF